MEEQINIHKRGILEPVKSCRTCSHVVSVGYMDYNTYHCSFYEKCPDDRAELAREHTSEEFTKYIKDRKDVYAAQEDWRNRNEVNYKTVCKEYMGE